MAHFFFPPGKTAFHSFPSNMSFWNSWSGCSSHTELAKTILSPSGRLLPTPLFTHLSGVAVFIYLSIHFVLTADYAWSGQTMGPIAVECPLMGRSQSITAHTHTNTHSHPGFKRKSECQQPPETSPSELNITKRLKKKKNQHQDFTIFLTVLNNSGVSVQPAWCMFVSDGVGKRPLIVSRLNIRIKLNCWL